MNLFLSVRPFLQEENETSEIRSDQSQGQWKPNLFDTGPWTYNAPSSYSSIAEEKCVSTTVWGRANVVANMRNGKGFFIFSYGPSQSGKTCKLLGGRMARIAKNKDDEAPKTSILHCLSESNSSILSAKSSVVDLEPLPCSYEDMKRQYLALLGDQKEEDYGEHSILSTFLHIVVRSLSSKGNLSVSAVEYFDCEWFDLLSNEVYNLQDVSEACWKRFESATECISFLVEAQNRRLEPTLPNLTCSISHLVVQIRFCPFSPIQLSDSVAVFVDLAGCDLKGLPVFGGMDHQESMLERSLCEFRAELLGKHMKTRVPLVDRIRSVQKNDIEDVEKQKQTRWRKFLCGVTQRDPSSIFGIFTIPPSAGENNGTDQALLFSQQLWKLSVSLPQMSTRCRSPRNEKERVLKRVYGSSSQRNSASRYRSTNDIKQQTNSIPSDVTEVAVCAAIPINRPLIPTARHRGPHSARHHHKLVSLVGQQNSEECMKAALGCIGTHRREERPCDLLFIALKEENCRLAVIGMERQSREVLWLRLQLINTAISRQTYRQN